MAAAGADAAALPVRQAAAPARAQTASRPAAAYGTHTLPTVHGNLLPLACDCLPSEAVRAAAVCGSASGGNTSCGGSGCSASRKLAPLVLLSLALQAISPYGTAVLLVEGGSGSGSARRRQRPALKAECFNQFREIWATHMFCSTVAWASRCRVGGWKSPMESRVLSPHGGLAWPNSQSR